MATTDGATLEMMAGTSGRPVTIVGAADDVGAALAVAVGIGTAPSVPRATSPPEIQPTTAAATRTRATSVGVRDPPMASMLSAAGLLARR